MCCHFFFWLIFNPERRVSFGLRVLILGGNRLTVFVATVLKKIFDPKMDYVIGE